jgi:hypothetical protein
MFMETMNFKDQSSVGAKSLIEIQCFARNGAFELLHTSDL